MAIILSEKDLAPLFDSPAAMDELLKLIEESMAAHNRGQIAGQSRVETSLTDPTRKYRIMTAAVPGAGQNMRINALFRGPRNAYFHLLFDGEKGDLLAVIAGRGLNAWRTGAPAGVASRYLARSGSESVGLLGSGRQARGQLLAIHRALPSVMDARVFSPTEAHRAAFAKEMTDWLGISVTPAPSARAALQDAPVVSIATNSRSSVLDADWIAPGALVVSITHGQLPAELVARSRVIVSWKQQVLAAHGPHEPYTTMIANGTWSGDKIAGELGEVILGKIPARRSDRETVLFESAGMPAWDTAASAWVYRWALQHNIGAPFSLA